MNESFLLKKNLYPSVFIQLKNVVTIHTEFVLFSLQGQKTILTYRTIYHE